MLLITQLILRPLALKYGIVHLVVQLVCTLDGHLHKKYGLQHDARVHVPAHHVVEALHFLLLLGQLLLARVKVRQTHVVH